MPLLLLGIFIALQMDSVFNNLTSRKGYLIRMDKGIAGLFVCFSGEVSEVKVDHPKAQRVTVQVTL